MDIAVLANQETIITFAMVMRLLAKKGKRLGKLLLYAIFCPFGRREIGELLRIVKV